MAAASSGAGTGGVDPRYPEAFQRGGAASSPVVEDPAVVRGAATASIRMPAAGRTGRAAAPAPVAAPGTPVLAEDDASAELEPGDVRYAELVVAGNPWLRSLWAVGAIAVVAGFALTVYAEFAFSVPPASGIYDPSVYIVPRIAEAVAQPLVIAGVIALVAATALRIVVWRPSAARAVPRD